MVDISLPVQEISCSGWSIFGYQNPVLLVNFMLSKPHVVQFILELAESFGEASEGRQGRRNLHSVKDKVVYFLPASYSITGLYRQFLKKYRYDHPQTGKTAPLSFA